MRENCSFLSFLHRFLSRSPPWEWRRCAPRPRSRGPCSGRRRRRSWRRARRRRGWPRRKTPQPGGAKVWAASSTVSRDSVKGHSNPGPFILYRKYCTYTTVCGGGGGRRKQEITPFSHLNFPFLHALPLRFASGGDGRKGRQRDLFANPDSFTDCRGKRRHRFSRPFMGNVHCTVPKAAFRWTNGSNFISTWKYVSRKKIMKKEETLMLFFVLAVFDSSFTSLF